MPESDPAVAVPVADDEQPAPKQEIFHLDLHARIEAQQTSHGVRHDDYAQYHGYCTRRLSRLSHLPDAKKYLVSNQKYATVKQPQGSGRHAFCSRHTDTLSVATPDADADADDSGSEALQQQQQQQKQQQQKQQHVPHVNVLWYLLVLSERAWAHANQISKQQNKQKRRQQVLKKLKRATQWAYRLLQKAELCCDASTIQECQAYASWMAANYALEQTDFAVRTHTIQLSSTEDYSTLLLVHCEQRADTRIYPTVGCLWTDSNIIILLFTLLLPTTIRRQAKNTPRP
jgi:hypothetical protein